MHSIKTEHGLNSKYKKTRYDGFFGYEMVRNGYGSKRLDTDWNIENDIKYTSRDLSIIMMDIKIKARMSMCPMLISKCKHLCAFHFYHLR